MGPWIELAIILIVIINILLITSSRIAACIQMTAVQGAVIGFLFLFIHYDGISFQILVFSLVSIILKAFIFPRLLFRAQREANVRKEVEPIGGYAFSFLAGISMFLVACWLSSRLPYPHAFFSEWAVPVSFATFFTGLFIIVSRIKALTQVLGYLVLENGIYLFGMALLTEQSFIVELAILLDVFVAVFVMGIAVFHISREFDHIDTQNLSELTDWVRKET